ncbi:hypothetical protein CERZMDRAFT_52321, partial [Cercospora zeae-maydis SCOH1-5]
QERIARVIDLSRVAIHYGYLPLIIYLGYTRSNPRPTLIRYSHHNDLFVRTLADPSQTLLPTRAIDGSGRLYRHE